MLLGEAAGADSLLPWWVEAVLGEGVLLE